MSSKIETYWLEDTFWYAPLDVIYHYGVDLDSLPNNQKSSKHFKKADEMLVTAIALLGIQLDDSRKYWLQLVPDSEGSPDVRTGCPAPLVKGEPPLFETQDIEVVGFMPEPSENIATFLCRTKLSPEKAYDAKTLVLCHMQTGANIPSLPAITEALQVTGAICPVMILGRTHPERRDYSLFQIYPQFKTIADYNVLDVLKTQTHTGALNLNRGTQPRNISQSRGKHCPFESLGFECTQIIT